MSHFWIFVSISGSILLGWLLRGLLQRRTLEEAVNLVHELDAENRRLTLNILDLHRTHREHDCEKKP